MEILIWIIFGLIVGAVAKFLMPGNDPGGIILTIIIGIVGAVLGGWIGRATGMYQPGEPVGFVMSVVGAIVLLLLYRLLFARSAGSERRSAWLEAAVLALPGGGQTSRTERREADERNRQDGGHEALIERQGHRRGEGLHSEYVGHDEESQPEGRAHAYLRELNSPHPTHGRGPTQGTRRRLSRDHRPSPRRPIGGGAALDQPRPARLDSA